MKEWRCEQQNLLPPFLAQLELDDRGFIAASLHRCIAASLHRCIAASLLRYIIYIISKIATSALRNYFRLQNCNDSIYLNLIIKHYSNLST